MEELCQNSIFISTKPARHKEIFSLLVQQVRDGTSKAEKWQKVSVQYAYIMARLYPRDFTELCLITILFHSLHFQPHVILLQVILQVMVQANSVHFNSPMKDHLMDRGYCCPSPTYSPFFLISPDVHSRTGKCLT